MIAIIINLIVLLVLSVCLFNASDTCEKSLHYRSDSYDKDEYYKKKLATNIYYVFAFIGMFLALVELFVILWQL